MTKCPKCEFIKYKAEVTEVTSYRYKLNFIRCVRCHTVVGVIPYFDPGMSGHQLEVEVGLIKKSIDNLEGVLQQVLRRLPK